MHLLQKYNGLKQAIKAGEENLKDLKEQAARLEEQLLDQFAEAEVRSVKACGATFFLQKTLWASVENTPAAYAALQKVGLGAMVQPRVNAQTLSSYVREQADLGRPLPAEIEAYLKISEKWEIRVRQS